MTQPVDTLSVSQSVVDAFTSQAAYDYKRELVHTETNYLEEFFRWIERLFETGAENAESVRWDDRWAFLWWMLVVVAVAVLAWWIYTTRFAQFARHDEGDELDYDVQCDNIHEIDFGTRLAEARQRNDHRAVCRLLYLQTLKRLSDGGLIDWRPFKTPSQYSREVGDPQLREMTNAFLKVRYGNFNATEQLCAQMEQWQKHLLALIPDEQQEKGGETS